MKLPITIEYNSGEQATYVAAPPEWARWERNTGNTIQQVSEKLGISDLMFLAYHAMKRENAGAKVLPLETWMETIADVQVGDFESPKATKQEA